MARRKAPEDETVEEQIDRQIKETVANNSSRSEKISWNRKMDNMVKLMSLLRPVEEKIIELHVKKQPIFDEIQNNRIQMVAECIHPFEYLVVHNGIVTCKFCDKNIVVKEQK